MTVEVWVMLLCSEFTFVIGLHHLLHKTVYVWLYIHSIERRMHRDRGGISLVIKPVSQSFIPQIPDIAQAGDASVWGRNVATLLVDAAFIPYTLIKYYIFHPLYPHEWFPMMMSAKVGDWDCWDNVFLSDAFFSRAKSKHISFNWGYFISGYSKFIFKVHQFIGKL